MTCMRLRPSIHCSCSRRCSSSRNRWRPTTGESRPRQEAQLWGAWQSVMSAANEPSLALSFLVERKPVPYVPFAWISTQRHRLLVISCALEFHFFPLISTNPSWHLSPFRRHRIWVLFKQSVNSNHAIRRCIPFTTPSQFHSARILMLMTAYSIANMDRDRRHYRDRSRDRNQERSGSHRRPQSPRRRSFSPHRRNHRPTQRQEADQRWNTNNEGLI